MKLGYKVDVMTKSNDAMVCHDTVKTKMGNCNVIIYVRTVVSDRMKRSFLLCVPCGVQLLLTALAINLTLSTIKSSI
eukprot:1823846-Amphidinium_carterae.1